MLCNPVARFILFISKRYRIRIYILKTYRKKYNCVQTIKYSDVIYNFYRKHSHDPGVNLAFYCRYLILTKRQTFVEANDRVNFLSSRK